MNNLSSTGRRRWLLSLLATRPGRRLLRATVTAALVANLTAPVFAGTQATSSLIQNPKSPLQNPHSNPAVQNALQQLGLEGPAGVSNTPENTVGNIWAGDQFQVNSLTTYNQGDSDVAIDSEGDFVVVWSSFYTSAGNDNHYTSIQGQRFNSFGIPQGSQFQVNTYTSHYQAAPAVALDADGDFVVVWESYRADNGDNSRYSIQAQRYNSVGVPQGSQFRVNSYTLNDQQYPDVAMDLAGNFVIVYSSVGSTGNDNSGASVQGRRYDAAGTPLGSEFQVNSYTTSGQSFPAVATDDDGDFVVVWASSGSDQGDTSSTSVHGRRFNSAAVPQGSDFQVNTYTTYYQEHPDVALDSDGDFVVVWHSNASPGNDDSHTSIMGRRFNSLATAQGNQFQVNRYTSNYQQFPAVVMDGSGNFVIAWQSHQTNLGDDSTSVQGKQYDHNGVAQGSQFLINRYTTSTQSNPAIAMNRDGNFVVTWGSAGSDTGTPPDTLGGSVQGRRYLASPPPPPGGQFQVNSYTTSSQDTADVAVDGDGDFVVVWQSYGSSGGDTSGSSIQGQRYNSAGTTQGSQFQINSYTTGLQRAPQVVMDDDGDFVVVWQSDGSSGGDTSNYSIQGQRYNSLGAAQGSQFQVNTYTTDKQAYPDVAMDGDGDFVVVWDSYGSAGNDNDYATIQGRRYNSAGTAQGNQFQVNSYTTDWQGGPAVAMDDDGDFVVAWTSIGSTGSDTDWTSLQGQRYNSVGTTQGTQFQINSYTTGHQSYAAVAMDSDGDFVAVWQGYESYYIGYYSNIQGQRFNSLGVPQGVEFQVNNFTFGNQMEPAVSLDADGDFVVAWYNEFSNLDDEDDSVLARQYNRSGTAQSMEFLVNSYTSNWQASPAVTLDSDGDFVVVWHSLGSNSGNPIDSSSSSIQAQRYLAGVPSMDGQFQINNYTTDTQDYPAVAMDSDGDFVVVWMSEGSAGNDSLSVSIQGQRFNAAGTAQGTQFQVNSYTTNGQLTPAVAMSSDGHFVVVWQSYGSVGNDNSSASIQGQRYNSDGAPQGSQFQVNTLTNGLQAYPDVALDSSGNFAVVWSSSGIQGQRYNAAGTPQGGQFQINSYTTTSQLRSPAVALDSNGDFVVVWEGAGSPGNDNSGRSIQGRHFNSAGTAQGDQFQVNSYTTNSQLDPAVAIDSDGDFVVVWESEGSASDDNSSFSIQGQRYNQLGTAQGSQFQINVYTTNRQHAPEVAMDSNGEFAVIWSSNGSGGNDSSVESVQGRTFDQHGLPSAAEFQVNSLTNGNQGQVAVAMDHDGDFVATWTGFGSLATDTNSYSVQGKRFNRPDSGQFQVNTATTLDQTYPAVAMDSDGDFVVVWNSYDTPYGPQAAAITIQGQRYNSAGVPQGSQFLVGTSPYAPAVAMDSDGDFVVIWTERSGDPTDYTNVYGQRYNSAGTAQGSTFQVNTYTTDSQDNPAVAMDNDGDFVVVWQSDRSNYGDTDANSIQGQRYNSSGAAQGGQFQVNSYTTGHQSLPVVAMDSNGRFVVVWTTYLESVGNDISGLSLQGRRFDSNGLAQGSDFQVNTYTTRDQHQPAVALDADGDFVVVWRNEGHLTEDTIQGQRFNSNGAFQGGQFQINSYTTGHPAQPSVSIDNDGDFVVVWDSVDSSGDDTSIRSIQGQRFDAAGQAIANQFLVNSYTTSTQGIPAVAMDDDGDFTIVWQSYGSNDSDSDGYSIQGKRFGDGLESGAYGQVNTFTTGDQQLPAVAIDSDGDFVVVWESDGSNYGDTDSFSIQGQRYNAAGTAQGPQFQVNNLSSGDQRYPSVAMDSSGDFVVVWESYGSFGDRIEGRRYNSNGSPQGDQFQVSSYGPYGNTLSAVAMDSDGDFVVVWSSYFSSGSDGDFSIQARRYNSAGTAQGVEFQVNSYTTGGQRNPAVAMDESGDFVIVWQSDGSGGSDTDYLSIQGQRYNSTGTAQGSQFQVNSYTTDGQWEPAVALDSNGDFVVVWHSYGSPGNDDSYYSIQGRRYNSLGTAQGSQFQINTATGAYQHNPAVAMDSEGNFAVTWESGDAKGNDDYAYSIKGRVFNPSGLPLLTEFQVNQLTMVDQTRSAVAMDSDGDFVVAWQSEGSAGNDSDGSSIQAGRFDLGQLDFQVNTYTTGQQRNPAVAIDSDGDFVIVWQSEGSAGSDNSLNSIQARRFDSSGVALGSQFQVNSYTNNQQRNPVVAMDADGDFLIVWQSYGANGDSSGYSIQGQRYNSAGAPQGSQFLVNSYTTSQQRYPAVAMDGNGNFVITWQSNGSSNGDTSGYSIQQRRYNAAGTALDAADVRVNFYTTNDQQRPAIAVEANGDFVVVWQSNGASSGDSSGFSIQGQRFNSTGTMPTNPFQVNSYTTNNQSRPAVAMDGNGDFVVIWQSNGAASGDTSGYSIQGQRYTNTGASAGGQFGVNSYTTSNQLYPAVAMDSEGHFVVVWRSNGSAGGDNSSFSIQGQRYLNNGTLQGLPFQVNTYTTNQQDLPAVAVDSDGDMVVTWDSLGLANMPFLQPLASGLEMDSDYTIVASRFTSMGGPGPSAVTLQESSAAVPARGGLLAVLAGAAALLTAGWLRLRRRKQ
jgi:hypothetical protein